MSSRHDKRTGLQGQIVSKEEVLAELGHPSTWERDLRRGEFEKRLIRGHDDLEIGGIRGYGRTQGYLAYVEGEIARRNSLEGRGPSGLVTPEEDEEIRLTTIREATAEAEKYRARLTELEKSPESVTLYIDLMKRWLEFCEKTVDWSDPKDEDDEEVRAIMVADHAAHLQEIETLKRDIAEYEQRLGKLRPEAPKTH